MTPGEQYFSRACRQFAGHPDAALKLEVAALLVPVLDEVWA